MLKIGLTGGIAAGKSAAARRLTDLGAVLIDADLIAREVVAPGTAGLAAVAEAFGPAVLDEAGALDRAALGALVFADPVLRQRLNSITHPLIRGVAAERIAAAPPEAVIVQDVPLLVESGQGAAFHLVLVIEAGRGERIERMVRDRGMSTAEAEARMAAQATDEQRRAAADIVLRNDKSPADLAAAVDRLWAERLWPFRTNLLNRVRAPRPGPVVLADYDAGWPAAAGRLADRLLRLGPRVLAVDHIGSTAVPGLPAKDVLDLQLTVRSLTDADALEIPLAEAGFPRVPGVLRDNPNVEFPDRADWEKRLHANADPGRAVNLHVRVAGSPGFCYALAFRDWLRSEPVVRAEYLGLKRRLAAEHAGDPSTAGYAEAKEPWFGGVAAPGLQAWKETTGWLPPAY